MKTLQDIYTTHDSIIDTLISQKAMYDSEWQKMMVDAMEMLEDSSLKYLDISKQITSIMRWTMQMLVNNNSIIKTYQNYIGEVQENIEIIDTQIRELEEHIDEMRSENEELRVRAGRLQHEIDMMRERMSKYQISRDERQQVLDEPEIPNEEDYADEEESPENDESEALEEEQADEPEQEEPEVPVEKPVWNKKKRKLRKG